MAKKFDMDTLCANLEACVGKDTYGTPECTVLKKLMAGGYKVKCAGLIVAAGKSQGVTLHNGSNSIWRKYLSQSGWITDGKPSERYPHRVNGRKSSNLKKGMLVFKWQSKGCSNPVHEKDGKGNYCHVGMVTSENPLHIVESSSVYGGIIMDKKIGTFCAWGWPKGWPAMNDTETKATEDTPDTEPASDKEEDTMENATGRLQTTSAMNVRKGPGTEYGRIGKVKCGAELDFAGDFGSGWVQIDYNGEAGYICTTLGKRKYCKLLETYDEEEDEEKDSGSSSGAGSEDVENMKADIEELQAGFQAQEEQMTVIINLLKDAGIDVSSIPYAEEVTGATTATEEEQ